MAVRYGGANYYYWQEVGPQVIDPVKEFQTFIATFEPYTTGTRVMPPQWVGRRTVVTHAYPKMEPRFPRTTYTA